MDKIVFGTDGWRAIIAKDYTITNVSKVAAATATWLTKRYKTPSAVIGYDCRFGGEMFMEAVAFHVYIIPVTTDLRVSVHYGLRKLFRHRFLSNHRI